ncbi:hypothetical protein BC937DRAFT_89609 [Endogone sp. FLAS-F59071]|nr:hypothetical protein BC937DRAFT_89609 [Endogone sp. FLAS-F59071]|eukprot:RUS17690.1 hypothetical protein BC937DRAFT_89609 [Endogone sp. FLAS-F59071]
MLASIPLDLGQVSFYADEGERLLEDSDGEFGSAVHNIEAAYAIKCIQRIRLSNGSQPCSILKTMTRAFSTVKYVPSGWNGAATNQVEVCQPFLRCPASQLFALLAYLVSPLTSFRVKKLRHKLLLVGHKAPVVALCLTQTETDTLGKTEDILISASEDGEVIRWNVADGRCLATNANAFVNAIINSPLSLSSLLSPLFHRSSTSFVTLSGSSEMQSDETVASRGSNSHRSSAPSKVTVKRRQRRRAVSKESE